MKTRITTQITSVAILLMGFCYAQEMQLTIDTEDPPVLVTDEIDFGTAKKGSPRLVKTLKVTNTGNLPLIIADASASCGCTVPTYPQDPIMPNETKEMQIAYSATTNVGAFTKVVTIISNVPDKERRLINVKGEIVE